MDTENSTNKPTSNSELNQNHSNQPQDSTIDDSSTTDVENMDISPEDATPPPEEPPYDNSDFESPEKPKRKKRYAVLVILMWLGFFIPSGIIYFFFWGISENHNGYFGGLPEFTVLENPSSELTSELYSADNVLLGKYYRSNRKQVDYDSISKNVIDALHATEDVRFEQHCGIDMKGTFAIAFYLAKGEKRGSSTITQQLAKNLFSTRTEAYRGSWSSIPGIGTVIIKFKEWITSVKLEKAYTKKEIISMYLNTVDFGSHSFGIEVAAKTFFGKPQKELLIEEAAILTGVLKAPTYYSPVRNYENAFRRRNTVLQQLLKYHYIDQHAYDSVSVKPIALTYNIDSHIQGQATYFRQEVGKFLRNWCKQNGYDLYADGLKIYTTIDSKMQQYAEAAVDTHMSYLQEEFFKQWKGQNPWSVKNSSNRFEEMDDFIPYHLRKTPSYRNLIKRFPQQPDSVTYYLNKPRQMTVFSWQGNKDTSLSIIDSLKYMKHFLHTGFMSMNPHTGEIKAWVGGINFEHFKYDHVQHGTRQPGSTFKPIVYAAILGESDNITPCTEEVDAPVTFMTGDPANPTWTPKNADGKYSGEVMTLRQAMGRSVNSITAQLMKKMGDQTPFIVKQYAEKLGITSELQAVPAMCLGTNNVYLYDMVGAYSTFANKGMWTEPYYVTRIEDKYGRVIKKFPKKQRRVLSPEQAYTMLYMLMGATQERGGTSVRLGFRYDLLADNEVGAKTGTTSNYSDGWFMGVTQDLVSGVWVGAEDRAVHFKSIRMGQGAEMALPIWAKYMQKVYADSALGYKKKPFERPNGDLSDLVECGYIDVEIDSSKIQIDSLGQEIPEEEKDPVVIPLYGDDSEDEGLH